MGRLKILLVDDDPDFVDATTKILESGGYDVVVAMDGEEGLRKTKEEKPDLIILDIMMPGREGYSVCRDLKEEPDSFRIPILVLTALSSKERGEGYAAKIAAYHKADDFMEKPVTAKELLDKVQRLLVKGVVTPELKERKKILIVDDDPDFVNATRRILEANDYEVLAAENGEEGIKMAKVFLPDAIILDVILPDKDGYSVCYELKKDGKTRPIPIIILTVIGKEFTKPDYAEDIAIDHLADDYADKPIKPEQLLKKIRRHIAPYY